MPMILQTLDEIACEKQRDVLCISFHNPLHLRKAEQLQARMESNPEGWEDYPPRKAIMQWLAKRSVSYKPCYPMLDHGWIALPYMGHIYVDVPYDLEHPQYRLLAEHLEDAQGNAKIEGVFFCFLPLKQP